MSSWQDSLTPALYLEECHFLTTIPLAKDSGMTTWILVNRDLLPDDRIIYSSCETYRKQSITSDTKGVISENIVHGIASVFSPSTYRGRGYAARMMKELIPILYQWQTDAKPCVGTTLYSDIGRKYYANLGWTVNVTNTQIEIKADTKSWPLSASRILDEDLAELCASDEALVRYQMSTPSADEDLRFCVLPDTDHMRWHHGKEDFSTKHLFGKTPQARGVIFGEPGNQMWAIWSRRYYGRHDSEYANNVLYILRLVIETGQNPNRVLEEKEENPDHSSRQAQVQQLKMVLEAAQAEAAAWHLDVVKLWDPSPVVLDLLPATDITFEVVERQNESIASLFWYDEKGKKAKRLPLWVNNEHYAWQ